MKSRMISRGVMCVSAPTRPYSAERNVKIAVHGRKLFDENEELLDGERRQVNDGRHQVAPALAHKAAGLETRAKRFVAENSAAAIFDALGGAAHHDADVARLSLKRVVVHRENLLVVVLARNGVRDFVEIDELVNENEETFVARALQKERKDLEKVVPVVVGGNEIDAERSLGFGLRSEFAAEPLENKALLRFGFVECACSRKRVAREDAPELEPVHDVVERRHVREDAALERFGKTGRRRGKAALGHFEAKRVAPALENKRERTALGHCFGGEVLHELAVGGKPLTLRAVQPALGREVGVGDDEAAVHDVAADRLKEKTFAAAVLADNEAKRGADLFNDGNVVKERVDFRVAPDGDVREPDARHDAALQGVQNRFGNALRYARGFRGRFFRLRYRRGSRARQGRGPLWI